MSRSISLNFMVENVWPMECKESEFYFFTTHINDHHILNYAHSKMASGIENRPILANVMRKKGVAIYLAKIVTTLAKA